MLCSKLHPKTCRSVRRLTRLMVRYLLVLLPTYVFSSGKVYLPE